MGMSDNIVTLFGKAEMLPEKALPVDIQKEVDNAFDKIEGHVEGKKRCMDMLQALAGQPLGKNRKVLQDKKSKAHFDAKNRL